MKKTKWRFPASDRSANVTVSTYYVDGGMVRYAQPFQAARSEDHQPARIPDELWNRLSDFEHLEAGNPDQ